MAQKNQTDDDVEVKIATPRRPQLQQAAAAGCSWTAGANQHHNHCQPPTTMETSNNTTFGRESPLFEASRRLKTSRAGGKERRRQLKAARSVPKVVVDARGDESGKNLLVGNKAEATPREGVEAGPKPAGDSKADAATADSGENGSLFRGDRRQKKLVFTEFSETPREVLQVQVSEIPEPASDTDVVVKVTASTVSLQDCMLRKGVAFETGDLPLTPGMDIVGNIITCGKKVRSVYVGDRVATLVRVGGNARYISVPASTLVEVPRSLDAAEAACMVSTYLAAYQCIRKVTNDSFSLEGKRVLITGSMEPVGQALVQLCLRAGALEIYATAPTLRHRYVKSVLGVHPLPPDPADWLPLVQGKMHFVFDGACQDDLSSPYGALRNDGVLLCLGMSSLLSRETPGVFGAPLSAYWARIKGQLLPNSIVYDVWESFLQDRNSYKLDLEILFHLLKKKFIKPHIAKRIGLSEVAEAQASLEEDMSRGEIVCLPWKRGNVLSGKGGKL